MTVTKKPGRPKSFDRETALNVATGVFWAKGYEGASMKDLTSAMGINSPSLYAEFGDKRGLYLQAIDRYANNDACAPLVALEDEPDLTKAVGAFFNATIDYATQHDSGAKGCFLAACVATSVEQVEGTQELLQEAIVQTDARIARRFDFEKQQGRLPPDFPVEERARMLFDLRQGLMLRARAGVPNDVLKADIAQRVAQVLCVDGR